MKLESLYRKAVETGVANDPRGGDEIRRLLDEERKKFADLAEGEKEEFDRDRLFNPYADTRILNGSPDTDVHTVILGIDMEVGEVLLTHLMNRDLGGRIDLIIAHHPEGAALARMHDVMKLQSDLLAAVGVSVAVAEQLMEKRISEVERRLMPANHDRAVDAARALGIPMMCIHTAADNCVTSFLKRLFDETHPRTLQDLLKTLKNIPEYKRSVRLGAPPKIFSGSESNQCGRIFVDMTGGTEGSKDIFEKYAAAGVSTLVGMHLGEEALERARKAHLNVVIAGHVSSDTLGLNLLFDEVEKEEPLEFVNVSGFERIRRKAG
jgi:putative NIF3 family GTP cyclohydrolase 1 type 2